MTLKFYSEVKWNSRCDRKSIIYNLDVSHLLDTFDDFKLNKK